MDFDEEGQYCLTGEQITSTKEEEEPPQYENGYVSNSIYPIHSIVVRRMIRSACPSWGSLGARSITAVAALPQGFAQFFAY